MTLSASSGRGKTTLCRLLAGHERPDSGQVLLDGLPLSQYRGFCPVQLLLQHPEEAVDPLLKLKTTLYEAGPADRDVLEGLGQLAGAVSHRAVRGRAAKNLRGPGPAARAEIFAV